MGDFVMNQQYSNTFNEKLAADYIGMSVSYLQKDRMDGILLLKNAGPRYAKVGKRVIYLKGDLDVRRTFSKTPIIGLKMKAQRVLYGFQPNTLWAFDVISILN